LAPWWEHKLREKWAACLSVGQLRWLIGQLLEEQLRRQTQEYICRQIRGVNRRKQAARFYHWKKRNRLPPLKIKQNTS